MVKRFHTRKVVVTVLLVTLVFAPGVGFLLWPTPTPIELVSVSAKSVGSMNGKHYKRVTAIIRNQSRFTFNGEISEIEVEVRGQSTDVDPGNNTWWQMRAGEAIKHRFYVQEEAEVCRLRLYYYANPGQPISPRQQALERLGPWAVNLVWKLPALRKWFADEMEPGGRKLTLQAVIPPSTPADDAVSPAAHN